MNTVKLMNIDDGLREPVRLLLNFRPEDRPDEHEFLNVRFLFLIKVLNFISVLLYFYRLNFSMMWV